MSDIEKTLIVAELSANHGNDLSVVEDTIKAAANSGADALKIQTFDLDQMTLNKRSNEYFISDGLWNGKYHYDLYKEIQLPLEWHERIFELCDKNNIICFSTPFDVKSASFLESLGNPIYKIASSEISHIPLIKFVSSLNKPVVISTGIASYEDIDLAVNTIKQQDNDDITVLKCTAAYPTPLEESNVLSMKTIRNEFNVKVGLSDHTTGHGAAVAAVANGACFIEKHFILDKSIKSADSSFSMTPSDFETMVVEIRNVEKALGSTDLRLTDKMNTARYHMRSIFAVKNIMKDENFSEDNICVMRPNLGLHPKNYEALIGQKARVDIPQGSPITDSMF